MVTRLLGDLFSRKSHSTARGFDATIINRPGHRDFERSAAGSALNPGVDEITPPSYSATTAAVPDTRLMIRTSMRAMTPRQWIPSLACHRTSSPANGRHDTARSWPTLGVSKTLTEKTPDNALQRQAAL